VAEDVEAPFHPIDHLNGGLQSFSLIPVRRPAGLRWTPTSQPKDFSQTLPEKVGTDGETRNFFILFLLLK
jgi:hypothetical protein